jgi:hypothetical protein
VLKNRIDQFIDKRAFSKLARIKIITVLFQHQKKIKISYNVIIRKDIFESIEFDQKN